MSHSHSLAALSIVFFSLHSRLLNREERMGKAHDICTGAIRFIVLYAAAYYVRKRRKKNTEFWSKVRIRREMGDTRTIMIVYKMKKGEIFCCWFFQREDYNV